MVDPAAFYDELADRYDVLFQDWWKGALWHGKAIAALLASEGVHPPAAVLDCACGIGTQALPLARSGYRVTGTDISHRAIARARTEAQHREVDTSLRVADMRKLVDIVPESFEAVIACDNALPHLLTDDDLTSALSQIRQRLRAGGVFVASIRDYDELTQSRAAGVPIALYGRLGERHGSGQAWSWSEDGEFVDITLFTLVEEVDGWRAQASESRYRALRRAALTRLMEEEGFTSIKWLTAAESGYFQSVVIARKGD